ncbi:hypothetical protein [Chitinimonas lacunae]|uniref:Uncharacterized protein n=1 Tax=Chitinimonas lacunae TaxID=1963018 RepID=A0ABV8MU33_9NEIS
MSLPSRRPLALALALAFAATGASANFYITDSAPRLYAQQPGAGPIDPLRISFAPVLKIEPGIRSAIYPYSVANSRAAPPGNMPKSWKDGALHPGSVLRLQILVPPGVSAIDLGTTMTTNFGAYSGTSGADLHLCPGLPKAGRSCSIGYVPGSPAGYIDFEDKERFGVGAAGSLAGRVFPNTDLRGVSTQPRWFNFFYYIPFSRLEGSWLDSLTLSMLVDDVPSYNRWLAARPWSAYSEPGVAKEASCDGLQRDWTMPCDGPAPWPGASPENRPARLPFGRADDIEPGIAADSAEWMQTGPHGPWEIGVVGGFYQVNGGAFTSEPGQIYAGDRVRLRAFAAMQPGASTAATLRVGATQSVFSVNTAKSDTLLGLTALDGGAHQLYSGRREVALGERIRLQERQAGVLNGTLRLSLGGSSVRFVAGSRLLAQADGEGLATPQPVEIAQAAETVTLPLAADPGNARAGFLLLGGASPLRLDLSAARAGDEVMLTVDAPYRGQVRIAQVIDATRYGEIEPAQRVRLTAGAPAMALPPLMIHEAAAKALDTSGNRTVGIRLPAGVSFDPAMRPGVLVTDMAGRQVPGVSATLAAEGGSLRLTLGQSWNLASNGPHKLTIDGLQVMAAATAKSGPLTLTVGGAATMSGALADQDIGSDLGARASRRELVFGDIIGTSLPWQVTPETVTVADPSAAVIRDVMLTVAEPDRGRSGALFVAALAGQSLYFLTPAGWQAYCTDCDLAYQRQGALDRHVLTPLPTPLDLRSLAPLQLLVGYGVGATAMESFSQMVQRGSYRTIYQR